MLNVLSLNVLQLHPSAVYSGAAVFFLINFNTECICNLFLISCFHGIEFRYPPSPKHRQN